ncbi:MAG: hypothetical protein QOE11_3537 [Solirubrobacteraceae bacterium]|jgi:hypothetical protein|nr:hypothetical protein [Solirubrobacteraceae bacterium]
MPRSSRAPAALAVLAAAALLGACGAGGKASTSTRGGPAANGTARPRSGLDRTAPAAAAAPSKASFVAFADGVCASFRADLAALDRSERAKQPAYRARRLADLVGAAVDRLTSAPRPRAGRVALDRYLRRLAEQRALLERLAGVVERGDAATARALNLRIDEVSRAAHVAAGAYGLVVCGS